MSNIKFSWEPSNGWLVLIPSTLPGKTEAGIELPDSMVRKANSGICIKAGGDIHQDMVNVECFFPVNNEYQIMDEGNLYYLIQADHIILTRSPRKVAEFLKVAND